MIQACLYLLAGIYALQLSSFASGSDLIALALVACFAAIFVNAWQGPSWLFVGLALFASSAARNLDDRLDVTYEGDSILAVVRIADFPRRRASALSFVAVPIGNERLPSRVRISWFEPNGIPALGDVWQFELRLRRPRGYRNPGVFDYEAWLFRSGIGATGYVVNGHRNRQLRADDTGMVNRLRRHVVERLVKLLPASGEAAVLAAISVGARHLVSAEQWRRYAHTGTSHLMAISGLHIGLAAGVGYLLARLVGGVFVNGLAGHTLGTIVAAFVGGLYGLMSGLAVPSQRAAVMIALVALIVIRHRQLRPFRILATTCLLLSIAAPISTMAPGFKLSFAAVLLIIWLGYRSPPGPLPPGLRGVQQLGLLQVVLLLGLLPLTVTIFGRAALVAPMVNLIVVPIFSLVTVPLTLAGMVFDGPVRTLGDRCLQIAALSVGAVEFVIKAATELPGADLAVPRLRGAARLLLCLPLLWVLLPKGWPGRGLAWLGALAIVTYQPGRPAQGCFEFGVLDVGQGLAVVVRTANRVLLYDTGAAFRTGSSVAQTVVLPYFEAEGVGRLDTLIVSHADIDHAGGVRALLSAIEIGRLLAGDPLPDLHSRAIQCHAGMTWLADGVQFRILHPPQETEFEGNDASCVLLVQAGANRLLISGDIEKPAERSLVQSRQLQTVRVVVIPHHGSQTSSSRAFVAALAPRLAIVSAGYGNRWAFPRREVVDRWQAGGATVISTANSGAIQGLLCSASGIEFVSRFRADWGRIWHE